MNLLQRCITLWCDLTSKPPSSKSTEIWQPPEGLYMFDIAAMIDNDVKHCRYEFALQSLLYSYRRFDIGNSGWLYEWASLWAGLSKRYSPAKKEYIKQRNDAELRCWNDIYDKECFTKVRAFNEMINRDRRTIRLFRKIAKRDFEAARKLYGGMEDTLIYNRCYRDCLPYLSDWQIQLKCRIGELISDRRYMDSIGDHSHLAGTIEYFRYRTLKMVGLLSKNNLKLEATDAASQCLVADNDEEYRLEINNALRGKLPTIWYGYAPIVFDEHEESIESL